MLNRPHQAHSNGVVHHQRNAVLVGNSGNGLEIGHIKFRVADGFAVKRACLISNGGAESFRIAEKNLSLVHEFVFKDIDKTSCIFAYRLMNASEAPVPEEVEGVYFERMRQMAERLKAYCENQ